MAAYGTNNGQTFTAVFAGSSPLSPAAPSDSSDGQQLPGLGAITVVVSADSGQTLSGAGTLQAYFEDDSLPGRFIRAAWADLTITASGVRDQAFTPYAVATPRGNGKFMWVPNAATFSGGAGLTVTQLGQRNAQLQKQGKWGG